MAKGYRPVVRDQVFLLPPDMRQWLPEDHPVWLVIAVVGEHLDTSAFHARRRTGGAGTAGYDPDMLLTVLVWAYAHKVFSSRDMERLCRTDVAFRVICGGNLPDHCTLARFRQGLPGAAADLFARVLVLCARLGMGKLGVVALDGTKVAASASKAANRTGRRLRELAADSVAAHAAADAAEDELFGAGRRGDEVPPDAWSPRRRAGRIAAALAGLEAEREAEAAAEDDKAAQFRARVAAGQAAGPAPKHSAVALAREGVDREIARQQAKVEAWERARAAGRAVPRRPQDPQQYCRVRRARAKLEGALGRAGQDKKAAGKDKAGKDKAAGKDKGPVRNITDPDSRLMPVRGGGFIQGYNAQNVISEDELVIVTELTDDTTDCQWYEPMIAAAQDNAAVMAAHRPPAPAGDGDPQPGQIGLVLSDAGYCSEANLTCDGPDRLIATGKRHDLEKAARAAADPGNASSHGGQDGKDGGDGGKALAAMAARLATEDGITAYRRRGHIAETPHGHIKHNMGFRQLTMRGKPKASAEWTFTCAVHNLFKALTTGHLTGQALTTLAS